MLRVEAGSARPREGLPKIRAANFGGPRERGPRATQSLDPRLRGGERRMVMRPGEID